jgi:hypothetical protein
VDQVQILYEGRRNLEINVESDPHLGQLKLQRFQEVQRDVGVDSVESFENHLLVLASEPARSLANLPILATLGTIGAPISLLSKLPQSTPENH